MFFGWSPGIGDPTFFGWLTVVAYCASSALCWRCARNSITPFQRGRRSVRQMLRDARFWKAMTIFLLLLGINKQLDLQTLFTDAGRAIAQSQGWYQERRSIQREFVVAIAGVALVMIAAALIMYRRAGRWVLLALCGAISLLAFVVIRAASFHHIDAVLQSGMSGFRVNHIMELGGILVIATAAFASSRKRLA